MMHSFLTNNREELVDRCKAKVAARPLRAATAAQLANGVPMFLDQLARTLKAEQTGDEDQSLAISGGSGGDSLALSQIGVSATAHGASLLALGYSVDQVVHDYGDLCQAITDLAFERDAPFTVNEFRTLNRCLDNAIADAVLEFSSQRDVNVRDRHLEETRVRVGFLVHELRNAISTATLAVGAIEFGNMAMSGATGAVLKRSLVSLTALISHAVSEVRFGVAPGRGVFGVAPFLADADATARLDANASNCRLTTLPAESSLRVAGNRALLLAALANLLQNAFKFTTPHTDVTLSAHIAGERVLIEVADHCGGLPPGAAEHLFVPFSQRNDDKSGLGLGLAIARDNVAADGGTLSVRDVPGCGCIFTISLHAHPDEGPGPRSA